MWKIFAGFIVFASLAVFVILKSGDKVDMQDESGAHSQATEAAPAR
jgi:hypothetical protein